MSGFQNIVIGGNVGRDPELKDAGGSQVCKFSVAVNGYKDHVEWFNVDAWGKQADACHRYLSKGSKVIVSGELETREREGKRYTTLRASKVTFFGSKSDGAGQGVSEPAGDDSELPF